jgi:hypothetical protein
MLTTYLRLSKIKIIDAMSVLAIRLPILMLLGKMVCCLNKNKVLNDYRVYNILTKTNKYKHLNRLIGRKF